MLLRNAAQSLLASTRTLPSSSSAAIPSLLSAFSHFSLSGPSTSSSSSPSILASSSRHPSYNFQQSRTKLTLTPRRSKYRKAFKGRIPVHTGGSTAGTTIEHGEFGLRVKDRPSRLSAKQLSSAHEALRRGIKPVKGAKVYIRVFPDIPVCIKVSLLQIFVHLAIWSSTLILYASVQGNETRMGKGKGTFEYWACRAPIGKVIFEVGGGGIAEQVAKDGE